MGYDCEPFDVVVFFAFATTSLAGPKSGNRNMIWGRKVSIVRKSVLGNVCVEKAPEKRSFETGVDRGLPKQGGGA